jgi:hypothetical protein
MATPNHLDIKLIKRGIEELKSLEIKTLGSVCTEKMTALKPKTLPQKGGVYIFWWVGDKNKFKALINGKLTKKGPKGSEVLIDVNEQWLDQFDENICLYVGKNNSNIKSRVGQHLRLSNPRSEKNNTSGQLKRGLQELFLADIDVRDIMLNNVGMSYFILDGSENSVNRFYLEDKAIGEFYPLINVDIER